MGENECVYVEKWKITGFQKIIWFIESFANIKRFSFKTFFRACEFLDETKKGRNFFK